ncbi:MAG: PLP-dependent transferase, partial [Actinobacteria bacterium]|nr:PLP-dependent transferase [Actinomycetota bacterium]
MRVVDLGPVAHVAREYGLALLVDATFASPINFRPLEHGADIAITSATKYLNGHSDVIAGAVAGSASFVEEVTRLMRLWGQAIDPHAAWLVDRGMRTLALRMARHNANGMAVAEWAAGHRAIAGVHYPGLASHPDHAVAERILRLPGGMLAFEVKGDVAAGMRVCDALQIAWVATSLGGVHTLVGHAASTTHRQMDPDTRRAAGIADGLIRVSVGLEDVEDLLEDFVRALEAA